MLSGSDSSFVCEPSGDGWRLDVGAPGAAVAGSGDALESLAARLAETPFFARQTKVVLANCGVVAALARLAEAGEPLPCSGQQLR